MLEQEIGINNYKILHSDRDRHGGEIACYIRNDLVVLFYLPFPVKLKIISFKISIPSQFQVMLQATMNFAHFWIEAINKSYNKDEN